MRPFGVYFLNVAKVMPPLTTRPFTESLILTNNSHMYITSGFSLPHNPLMPSVAALERN